MFPGRRHILPFLVLAWTLAADAGARNGADLGQVQTVSLRFDELTELALGAGNPWRPPPVIHPGTPFLLLHLRFEDLGQGDWTLDLENENGEVQQSWSGAQLRLEAPPTTETWSREIAGEAVQVVLHGELQGLRLTVDRYLHGRADPVIPRNIRGEEDFENIHDILGKEIHRWGQPVVNLKILTPEERYFQCTGFLLTSDLVLTNRHCGIEQAQRVEVEFDYETPNRQGVEIRRMVAAEGASSNADFAVLRLDEPVTRPHPIPLLDEAATAEDLPLILIQHPDNQPKQYTQRDCRVEEPTSSNFFHHTCDTLGGSSGSPVFNQDGRVLGLHRLGFMETGSRGANQAVKSWAILRDLRLDHCDLCQEIPGCPNPTCPRQNPRDSP